MVHNTWMKWRRIDLVVVQRKQLYCTLRVCYTVSFDQNEEEKSTKFDFLITIIITIIMIICYVKEEFLINFNSSNKLFKENEMILLIIVISIVLQYL